MSEKILTPDEVRALQSPNVTIHVLRINEELLKGSRSFYVPKPLAGDIATELDLSGWCAKVDSSCKYMPMARIEVIEDKL